MTILTYILAGVVAFAVAFGLCWWMLGLWRPKK